MKLNRYQKRGLRYRSTSTSGSGCSRGKKKYCGTDVPQFKQLDAIMRKKEPTYAIALPESIEDNAHKHARGVCVVVEKGTALWKYRRVDPSAHLQTLVSHREGYEIFLNCERAALRSLWIRSYADALYGLFVSDCSPTFFSFGSAGAHGYVYAGVLHGLATAVASSTMAEHLGRLGDVEWAYKHVILHKLQGAAGTSAGSFAALAIVTGASLADILGVMCSIDGASALRKDIGISTSSDKIGSEHGAVQSVVAVLKGFMRRDASRVAFPGGLLPGTFLTTLARAMLRQWARDEDITFSELHHKTRKRLCITACSLDDCSQIVFSEASHPDLPIHIAIRISASVPGVFSPVELHNELCSDGGIVNSAAIGCFPFKKTWSFVIAARSRPGRDLASVVLNVAQASTGFHPTMASLCAAAAGGDPPFVIEIAQPQCVSATDYAPAPQERARAAVHGHEEIWHWVHAHVALGTVVQAFANQTKQARPFCRWLNDDA